VNVCSNVCPGAISGLKFDEEKNPMPLYIAVATIIIIIIILSLM
jgi:hypothetical protein